MGVNKVVYGASTIIDITNTTATASKVLQGFGCYGADGDWINGTYSPSVSSGRVFYVYKTSNCTVLKIDIVDDSDWSFDITSLVSDGYLYFGYFSFYSGASKEFTAEDLESETFVDGVWADSSGAPCTGAISPGFSKNYAYTSNGRILKPVDDAVYYLGEVPNDYLRPVFLNYDGEEDVVKSVELNTGLPPYYTVLRGVRLTDSLCTKSVASVTTTAISIWPSGTFNIAYYNSLTFPDKTINVPRLFCCNVGVSVSQILVDLSDYSDNDEISFTPSWITWDGVEVFGVITGTLNIGDKTISSMTVTYSLYDGIKYDSTELVTPLRVLTVTPSDQEQTFTGATNYAGYRKVVVEAVASSSSVSLQSKSATPTESTQTITADSGYDGLSQVEVGAISSTYVGSGITSRSSSDLTDSGATVTAPAGYYSSDATKTIASGSEGTPTASKGTVSNNSISITPSVTNTAGYISGGTHTGTAVTVAASELVSGTKTITANGTGIDVTNYADVTVNVAAPTLSLQSKTGVTPTESSQTITADSGYDGLSSVQIDAISSTYVGSGVPEITENDIVVMNDTIGFYSANNIYPAKVTEGIELYIGLATNNVEMSINSSTGLVSATSTLSPLSGQTNGFIGTDANSEPRTKTSTLQLTTKAAATYYPSVTDQTITASQYLTGAQTIKGVTYSGLTASNIANGVTVKIGDSADDDRIVSVTGTLAFQTIYTGSSAPSSSAGSDGDIYIQTS